MYESTGAGQEGPGSLYAAVRRTAADIKPGDSNALRFGCRDSSSGKSNTLEAAEVAEDSGVYSFVGAGDTYDARTLVGDACNQGVYDAAKVAEESGAYSFVGSGDTYDRTHIKAAGVYDNAACGGKPPG